MDDILEAIVKMEGAGVTKDEMVVLLDVDYAKKVLKDTNDILLSPIKEFKSVYGVDCKVLWMLDNGVTFYIVTKKYLKEAGLDE